MLIRDITANLNESRIFRGEVLEIVQIHDTLTRFLLSDSSDDVIYCLLEGLFWVDKIRLIIVGDKLILGPFKVLKVPENFESFYAPKIEGKIVSDFYIHYQPHDLHCKLELERVDTNPLSKIRFKDLQECKNLATALSISRVNIIGVIVDFVIESRHEKDNLFKLKLVDQSLEEREFIQINIFLNDFSLKISNLGDIFAGSGISFRTLKGKAIGTYNKLSKGFGIYSWKDCKLACVHNEIMQNEEMAERVYCIQNWELEKLNKRDLTTGVTIRSIGQANLYKYREVDIFCYVIKVHHKFPDIPLSTILVCDETGFLVMQTYYCNLFNVKEEEWVKLREVKIEGNSIIYTHHSSIVHVAEWFLNIQQHIVGSPNGLKMIINEAQEWYCSYTNEASCEIKILVTTSSITAAPLLDEAQLRDPLNTVELCRFKALLIDIQPRNIGEGIVENEGKIEFYGIMIVWSSNEILSVSISRDEAAQFFEFGENKTKEKILEKINEKIKLLFKGNNWMEIGIQRKVKGDEVKLKLVKTQCIA
ncbi:unnamed protein product [Blepharisma stoltei]|uniref:Telomeric single stranded DNA binding POT1/Cdc13 domain-containing protein n=1 Tax=Blepharisma stoltei TaxID=1481888 RepID=A0AAU9JD32_9CILI|nr:unnamed protein product [Blepharisma stoltei]